ncbi:MAG: hypothetical protein ACSHYA_04080 [Opitutaceae bacterium]
MNWKQPWKSAYGRYQTLRLDLDVVKKRVVQPMMNYPQPERIIWIFGCQRSGTTFLERLFREDIRSAVWGEFSDLSIAPERTSLRSISEIKETLEATKAQYAVIRPLFESDRAVELLEAFPNSIAVWTFRDCPHVVDSMCRKWDQEFFAISKRVESDSKGYWRLEDTINKMRLHLEPCKFGDQEHYARFWNSRNEIPFRTGLATNPRCMFLNYEYLAAQPDSALKQILDKANQPSPQTLSAYRPTINRSRKERLVEINVRSETRSTNEALMKRLVLLSHKSFR